MATETSASTIDEEEFTVQRTVFIQAPVEHVWEAITAPHLIELWFGDSATIDRLEVGGTGQLGWSEHGDFAIEITEVVPGEVFAFRWPDSPGTDPVDGNSTVARFSLTAEDGGTVLTVVETGFSSSYPDLAARRAAMNGNRDGWDGELDELVALLEKQDSQ